MHPLRKRFRSIVVSLARSLFRITSGFLIDLHRDIFENLGRFVIFLSWLYIEFDLKDQSGLFVSVNIGSKVELKSRRREIG